jgi:hypothetical protein
MLNDEINEISEHVSAHDMHEDSLDEENEFQNVDVKAILFYGYTGRRCFPSMQVL